MSSVIIAGNTSGTITLDAPNVAGTTTLTLPTTTDTLVGRTTTDTLTNKTLTNPTFDSAQLATVLGTAPLYMCRAWVNFNGTSTISIRGSGNVSSITDNGTGDYTINFTTAMPNVNYAFTQHISCASTGALNDGCDWQSIATGSFRVLCGNGGTALDADYAMFSIFR